METWVLDKEPSNIMYATGLTAHTIKKVTNLIAHGVVLLLEHLSW